jgi:hypothetical protein
MALTRVASGTVKYLVRVGRMRVYDTIRTSRENIFEQLDTGRELRSKPQRRQMRYLITLLAMLVLRFSLESVGSVHPISNKVPQHLGATPHSLFCLVVPCACAVSHMELQLGRQQTDLG